MAINIKTNKQNASWHTVNERKLHNRFRKDKSFFISFKTSYSDESQMGPWSSWKKANFDSDKSKKETRNFIELERCWLYFLLSAFYRQNISANHKKLKIFVHSLLPIPHSPIFLPLSPPIEKKNVNDIFFKVLYK